jgi:hypothetical protein
MWCNNGRKNRMTDSVMTTTTAARDFMALMTRLRQMRERAKRRQMEKEKGIFAKRNPGRSEWIKCLEHWFGRDKVVESVCYVALRRHDSMGNEPRPYTPHPTVTTSAALLLAGGTA